jgi:glucan endo-1,3-alpha-glucosidase
VSWNDYGVSNYIGPIHSHSEVPAGSLIYVEGNPHDSWRDFLPYYIAKYKGSDFSISKDQMQYWYHTTPTAGGSTCGVVGNNANRNQTEISPNDVVEDGIFFSALLKEAAQVTVKIGSYPVVSCNGSTGINHWSQPFNGQTGVPKFSVIRGGQVIRSGIGAKITPKTTLSNGCTNYNAWVGGF